MLHFHRKCNFSGSAFEILFFNHEKIFSVDYLNVINSWVNGWKEKRKQKNYHMSKKPSITDDTIYTHTPAKYGKSSEHSLMHGHTQFVSLSVYYTHTRAEPAVWWKQVSLSAHYLWQGWSPCLESNKTHLTGGTEGPGGCRRMKDRKRCWGGRGDGFE